MQVTLTHEIPPELDALKNIDWATLISKIVQDVLAALVAAQTATGGK